VNSVPKCGTHLLTKCIELLTDRPLRELDHNMVANDSLPQRTGNEFFAHHVRYSKAASKVFRKHNYKTYLIYRDPRDRAISKVYWIQKGGWDNRLIKQKSPLINLPFDKLLTHVINRMDDEYGPFLPWMSEPNCCLVKFENLIGPQGGGSLVKQKQEVAKIASHINLPLNDALFNKVTSNIFGGSPTFREGRIGGWKKHFSEKHKQLFKQKAGRLLVYLGYEKDLNW